MKFVLDVNKLTYILTYEKGPTPYSVEVPDLCINTCGTSPEDALFNAKDAAQEIWLRFTDELEDYQSDEPINKSNIIDLLISEKGRDKIMAYIHSDPEYNICIRSNNLLNTMLNTNIPGYVLDELFKELLISDLDFISEYLSELVFHRNILDTTLDYLLNSNKFSYSALAHIQDNEAFTAKMGLITDADEPIITLIKDWTSATSDASFEQVKGLITNNLHKIELSLIHI